MKKLEKLAHNGGENFPKVNFDNLEGKRSMSFKVK
jgi:hypothetical protein